MQKPHVLAVARELGVSGQQVRNVVGRYNEGGPEVMADPRQGRPLLKRRLLNPQQEAELRAWMAERCGHKPDATSVWIYRRGCESHSRTGRRALRHVDA